MGGVGKVGGVGEEGGAGEEGGVGQDTTQGCNGGISHMNHSPQPLLANS